jgi:hypothetical protein
LEVGFDESVELLLALRGEGDPGDALAIGVGVALTRPSAWAWSISPTALWWLSTG